MHPNETQSTEGSVAGRSLQCLIELDYSDRANFAMQQNGIPLVESVSITSESEISLEDIRVELELDNESATSWTSRIARLDPGLTLRLEPKDFMLSAGLIATRTEAERSVIRCSVNLGEERVTKSFPVDLLAFDQWPGIGHYAEVTAAFATPNHPQIAKLLSAARESLGGLSDSDALDGYQSGSRQRASLIAEACYNALAAQGIGYINPPASFETDGQRVRLVDRVMNERLGTCLDLSLVLVGMLEQCGLFPLLLMPHGHAMPAVWTHETHLPETVIDEPARIRNLIELGEIIPIESTAVTQPGMSYSAAVDAAKQKMESPGLSFHAIDIRSARKRGVRPLPLRHDGVQGLDLDALTKAGDPERASSTLDRIALAEAAEAKRNARAADQPGDEDSSDRISRWRTKLLDLSLRNRLLNFRQTGRSLPLRVPDLAQLEDMLAGGERFGVYAKSDDPREFLLEEIRAGHLYASEPQGETQKRLLNLYRIAKSSIEETGANVLYLALGLLKWYESDTSEQERFAPLILLPISLTRHATGSGYHYTLGLNDEPLRPNVTLLEKLRVEFGIETNGLDDLPEDDSGIDVDLILRTFRDAIRDTSRWEVVESASIGMFSFNKFLMWKDLQDNIERLKSNRLVTHLVDRPGDDFDSEPFPREDELDDRLKPDDLLCTRDADSSQIAAVRSAADGRSFVLEGPPGTGKSQTIANIIADSLARGKRVLFVAEKMAALSVVRKRLEEDGIGPFCLELHSAKASKKQVLAQLEEALGAADTPPPSQWESMCRDLEITRDRLNTYVREMHKPRGTGESLYRVLGRLSLIGDGPCESSPTESPESTTPEQLGVWKQTIAQLQDRGKPVDPVHEHPLNGIGLSDLSFALREQIPGVLRQGLDSICALRAEAAELLSNLGVQTEPDQIGRDAFRAIVVAASQIPDSPAPAVEFLQGPESKRLRASLSELVALGRDRDTRRGAILDRYHEEVLGIEHLVQIDSIKSHLKQPAILRIFTSGKLKKSIRVYAKGELPAFPAVMKDLESMRELGSIQKKLESETELARLLGSCWNGSFADWVQAERIRQWADGFAKALNVIGSDPACGGVAEALAVRASSSDSIERLKPIARRVVAAWKAWDSAWQTIKSSLQTSSDAAFGVRKSGWLQSVQETLDAWNTNQGELSNWSAWREARDRACDLGLGAVVNCYERADCTIDEIDEVFWRSFGRPWFTRIADQVDAIRTFNAQTHIDAATHFRQLDTDHIAMSRALVAAKLGASAPSAPKEASDKSEIGILRRELNKKRRHLPTRRLIERMPTLLPRLKPCFLMSPLSVAQFLDTKLPPFDLVVFDEASQIPVWDAIGAIARGTEVIVVGDSKQLPPTAFFSTLDDDDDAEIDDHAVEDMESILKECNASGIPGMRLRWHYRSRHESLIAFSNHHYYDNQLHTFPSPDERSDRLGVTLRHVPDGVYDRGASRTNRIEAEQVVEHVVGLLLDPESQESIGIVTFNQAQQHLIEDLLDTKRREIPEIEPYFTNEVQEPVFVKNLENVQGDERDIIIFSVGYGPDQTGKPSMNFGPLNKDGGERRLNVAVTRARRRLIVFSSLTSDQIDLKRTRAVGVRHFKTFLDYAKRGPQAIAEAVSLSGDREFDSGFEQAVWKALTSEGWEVDTQVGCAGYRIDLAVRHPEKPGSYLLGIECDGAAYHSAKTARDRDRLRQSVLEGLGWTIERVWSTEWQINQAGCMEKLLKALEQALHTPDELVLPEEKPATGSESPILSGDHDEADDSEQDTSSTETEPVEPGLPEYAVAKVGTARTRQMDPYDAKTKPHMVRALGTIVEVESPITYELAIRRLAEAFGQQRITERFRRRFASVQTAAASAGIIRVHGDDYWRPGHKEDGISPLRVPGRSPESVRDIDHIPMIELEYAAAYILEQQFGLPRDELVREVVKLFGFKRATARISERADEAIERLINEHRVVDESGHVRVASGETNK